MIEDPEYKDIQDKFDDTDEHEHENMNESESEDINSVHENVEEEEKLEQSIERIEEDINQDFRSKVANIAHKVISDTGKSDNEKEKEITSKVFNVFMSNKTDLL